MTGASSVRKGKVFERRVARASGGARRPLSIDDTPVGGILEENFRVESKYRTKVFPKWIWEALAQAEANRQSGDARPSAVILGAPYHPAVFVAPLDDVLAVLRGISELAQSHKVRALSRQLRQVADDMDRLR